MIKLKNITKLLGETELLTDINCTLGSKTKTALIGPNGCGKSTLFRIILGQEDLDKGQIVIQDERIGYLPQELSFKPDETVHTFINSQTEPKDKWKIEKIYQQLGLDNMKQDQLADSLSEGQKMKLKLAAILFAEPSFLLLDEPTNHLDLEGILWFEEFVRNYSGGILMISHDRSFLDNTVNFIFEIDEHQLHTFSGNYTDYRRQKAGWIDKRHQQFHLQEQKRKQIEKLIENARKIQDGKKRSRAIQAAKKRMEREITRSEISQYQQYGIARIALHGETHSGKLILDVSNLSKKFGAKQVFTDLSFELRGNEHFWLFGKNGAGKSTLLNIITNNLPTTEGSVRVGDNVKWGYFKQNQAHLPKNMKLGDYVVKNAGLSFQNAYSFLTKYGFDAEFYQRKLGSLSPGERARISFAIFTQNEYDLLILDEPTNHLDLWTKESIETSLHDYKGAVLLVSHDRYFVENIGADRLINLDEGRLRFL